MISRTFFVFFACLGSSWTLFTRWSNRQHWSRLRGEGKLSGHVGSYDVIFPQNLAGLPVPCLLFNVMSLP